jgi:hypothetical protein
MGADAEIPARERGLERGAGENGENVKKLHWGKELRAKGPRLD